MYFYVLFQSRSRRDADDMARYLFGSEHCCMWQSWAGSCKEAATTLSYRPPESPA